MPLVVSLWLFMPRLCDFHSGHLLALFFLRRSLTTDSLLISISFNFAVPFLHAFPVLPPSLFSFLPLLGVGLAECCGLPGGRGQWGRRGQRQQPGCGFGGGGGAPEGGGGAEAPPPHGSRALQGEVPGVPAPPPAGGQAQRITGGERTTHIDTVHRHT